MPLAIEGTSVYESGSNNTSHPVTLPAGVQAGEMLLVACDDRNGGGTTYPAGWTPLKDINNGAHQRLTVAYKIASGGESTVSVATANSRTLAGVAYRLSGHDGNAPVVSTGATGSSNAPDPDTLTVGVAGDYLSIPIAAIRGGEAVPITAAPSGYGSFIAAESGSGASGSTVAMAALPLSGATSENPGAFAAGDSQVWSAVTVFVAPAAGGGGGTHYDETGLGTTVTVSTGGDDALHMAESVGTTITVGTGGSDRLGMNEHVGTTIASSVGGTDALHMAEHVGVTASLSSGGEDHLHMVEHVGLTIVLLAGVDDVPSNLDIPNAVAWCQWIEGRVMRSDVAGGHRARVSKD